MVHVLCFSGARKPRLNKSATWPSSISRTAETVSKITSRQNATGILYYALGFRVFSCFKDLQMCSTSSYFFVCYETEKSWKTIWNSFCRRSEVCASKANSRGLGGNLGSGAPATATSSHRSFSAPVWNVCWVWSRFSVAVIPLFLRYLEIVFVSFSWLIILC